MLWKHKQAMRSRLRLSLDGTCCVCFHWLKIVKRRFPGVSWKLMYQGYFIIMDGYKASVHISLWICKLKQFKVMYVLYFFDLGRYYLFLLLIIFYVATLVGVEAKKNSFATVKNMMLINKWHKCTMTDCWISKIRSQHNRGHFYGVHSSWSSRFPGHFL